MRVARYNLHDEKPRWVSVKDACRLSSLGRTKIFELIQAGVLKSTKIGCRRLVSMGSIEDLDKTAA
jgi:excisionase family DNA binding protein